MKKTRLLSLTFVLVAALFVQDSASQDLTQSGLPEGAVARLGEGSLGSREFATGSMVFSPDGQRVAVASSIGIYLATPRDLTLIPTTHRILSVAFSPDGKTLASVARRSPILLWDVETREIVATLDQPYSGNSNICLAFSPDGTTLAAGGEDYYSTADGENRSPVDVWDVETREIIATLEGHTDDVRTLAFSPDGRTLASGTRIQDGTVKLWDVASGTNIATLRGHTGRVRSVAFSPDGRTLASGDWDNTILLWDVASGTNIATVRGHADLRDPTMAFSPDGTVLAGWGFGRTILLWDVASGRSIATLETDRSILSVSFSPNGTLLAVGESYGDVQLWEVASGTNIATLEGGGWYNYFYSVSFSPDGTLLASGSDAAILIWNVPTREHVTTLEGHTGGVTSVSFSPDGTTLASGSEDGTVLLWDVSPKVKPQPSASHDFDGDGAVDFTDFLKFAQHFGTREGGAGYDARYDLDGDGAVGFSDFLIFAGRFGQSG